MLLCRFEVSSELFGGFALFLDIMKPQTTFESLAAEVQSCLVETLASVGLRNLSERARQQRFHIHDHRTFDEFFDSAEEASIYCREMTTFVCDHC